MPALGGIACVTIATPDIERSISMYRDHLGYLPTVRGPLGAETARLFGKPQLAQRDCALLYPQGNGPTAIRFVQSASAPQYRAFRHMGWNAAEIMVQDTDAAARHLANSAFKVIGQPRDLSFTDKIRAMQVLGPANESLYLTCFKEKMAEFDVPDARYFIDGVFIVILGGPSIASINDFYARHLGTQPAPAMQVLITVLADAQGLPPDTKFELAAIALQDKCFIEADAMPAATMPRAADGPELPPAIAMVSFLIDDLAATGLKFLSPPQRLDAAPYRGRLAAVAVGPAGELIELLQR